jgi:hypothetical protein
MLLCKKDFYCHLQRVKRRKRVAGTAMGKEASSRFVRVNNIEKYVLDGGGEDRNFTMLREYSREIKYITKCWYEFSCIL